MLGKGIDMRTPPIALMLLICLPLAAEPIISKAVEGQRAREEAGAFVLDERAIADSGASGLMDLLASEGFFVTEGEAGGQSRVTISGLTAQNIHVYIDGVLQNTAAYGRFDWNSIDLSCVERITIYRAGYCPLPEAASFSGAVIWIQTRSSALPRTVVDASALSYKPAHPDMEKISAAHTGTASLGGKAPPVSAEDAAASTSRHNIKEVSYKASVALTHAANDYCSLKDASAALASAGASVSAISEHSNVSLDYRFSHSDVNVPPNSGQAGEETDTSHAITLGASTGKGGWGIDGSVSYRHCLTEYSEDVPSSFEQGVECTNEAAGGEDDTHKLDTFALNIAVHTPPLRVFTACLSASQCADRLRSTSAGGHTRLSGFVKLLTTYQIFPAIAFDAGCTLDGYESEMTFNPFCALRFTYGQFAAVASYARLYQSPTMEQLYWSSPAIKGNTALSPEVGYALSLTAQYTALPCPVYAVMSYMDYRDKIRYADGTFNNLSHARILSCEVHASPQMRAGNSLLGLRLSYTFTSAKIAGGAQDGCQIMDVPQHTFAAVLTWKIGHLMAGINGEYVSKRYVSNWNAQANGAYFMLGAFSALDIPIGLGRTLSPYIKASNITDRRVFCDYTRTIYQRPRSVTCGVKLSI